jgi:adenylate cyclase
MPDQILPDNLQKRFGVSTVDEMWQKNLTEGNIYWRRYRHMYGWLPSNPRCVNCHRPFEGIGGRILHSLQGLEKSNKNPRYCANCHDFAYRFPGGAEIELSMLFVDVRGSTTIAEKMATLEFSRLMNRFYEAAINVLVQADAFIDKLVGDEVTALFVPGFAGPDHARRAVLAGKNLLKVTGHADMGGPWVPVGVGVHTGTAWVGSIVGASGEAADFTALGDNVNIAARLASQAAQGEVVASLATLNAAGINTRGMEMRSLALKGKSEIVNVGVLHAID